MNQLRSTLIEVPAGIIDFGVGQPGPSTLPNEVVRQAAAHRFSQPDSYHLNYGPEQGDGPFLEVLAQFLSDGYSLSVSPLSLMVTAGASQAIDLIISYFSQPGDTIFVEEPTYFLALPIFRDCGLNIVGIPMDEDGLRIDALEEALTQHTPKFVYTIPAHHNPTGVTLSATRRQRLLELSEAYDFYILADEVYQLLTYTCPEKPCTTSQKTEIGQDFSGELRDNVQMPLPFAAMIESERVFSMGSFSKILGPGMRLGWVQAGPNLMTQLLKIGFVYSGGSLNQISSQIVRSALELGLQQQFLAGLKETYGRRRSILCGALREQLGDVATFRDPTGGFFVWVAFPDEMETAALVPAARVEQVGILSGVNFASSGDLTNYMRFCFAHYEEEDLVEGVRRLARVF